MCVKNYSVTCLYTETFVSWVEVGYGGGHKEDVGIADISVVAGAVVNSGGQTPFPLFRLRMKRSN